MVDNKGRRDSRQRFVKRMYVVGEECTAISLKALAEEAAAAGANWVVSHFRVGVRGGGTGRVKAPRQRAPETCKFSETSAVVCMIFCCCCSLFKRLCVCQYLHGFDDKMHE